MKVKDLIEQLKKAPQDDDILIADKKYFGGTMNLTTHGIAINHVYIGFDWDMGKTYLIPEEEK
jgi:hypothetical protein